MKPRIVVARCVVERTTNAKGKAMFVAYSTVHVVDRATGHLLKEVEATEVCSLPCCAPMLAVAKANGAARKAARRWIRMR